MHTLLAEIYARVNCTVKVIITADNSSRVFSDLQSAEEFVFSLHTGEVIIASVRGKVGYLRATVFTPDVVAEPVVAQEECIHGVVRIGNGVKLHRAIKYPDRRGICIRCSCPNTGNGRARISGFWSNIQGTCGT